MLHKRYIIKEISSVLEYLGSMQVVHRDVKVISHLTEA